MKRFLLLGALFGFLAVIAGVIGAHALQPMLAEAAGEARFELAADYLLFHALALIAAALLVDRFPQSGFEIPGWLFTLGAALFRGSLFVHSLAGMGAILTPVGGLFLILGWAALLVQAFRIKPRR